jgi:hypothetical protein
MARRFRKIGLLGKLGIRKVNVPSLSGLTRAQAKQELESRGLSWQETAESTTNINLDFAIKDQTVASNSVIKIGDPVGFTYYNYVAPPNFNPGFFVPDPPQDSSVSSSSWNGSTVTVSGSFPTAPTNISVDGTNIGVGSWSHSGSQISFPLSGSGSKSIQIYNGKVPVMGAFTVSFGANPGFNPGFAAVNDCIDDDAGNCIGGVFYQNQYSPSGQFNCPARNTGSPCGNPNPGFNPGFNEPPLFDTPLFGGSGDLTNLDLSALFDFGGGKSIGITTLVRTTDGLVKAGDLQVGDTLLSVNIEGFPYESAEGVTAEAIAWSDNNPNIIPEITNIVALYKTQSAYAVVINEDIFSQYHYILIKRGGVSKFETSVNIVKETDLVYSYDTSSWEPIYLYEIVQVPHDIISINCEPYDMFFTERMLTHDSSAI